MHLSKRMQGLAPSPTVALNGKAKAMAAAGRPVLNFAVGEPDFPTPAPIRDVAIKALMDGKTKYGPAGGSAELRNAICNKLQLENQLSYSPDDVVVGTGAKEVLFHTFMALLNEGDEVILTAPMWVSYTEQILAAGGKAVVVPTPKDFPKLPIDLKAIDAHATDKTRVFVLNSPNNPAGYVLSKEALLELGAYLVKKDWWIISDEIYEYLAFDKPHYSLLQLFPELADRFILVNGMSKGYAMTGWRVGYVAGPKPAMQIVRNLQSQSSTCIPTFIDLAATFALQQGRSLVEDSIKSLVQRRDLAARLISKVPGIKAAPPEGAFYIFFQPEGKAGENTLKFCSHLLEQFETVMVPGVAFAADGFVRMSYATSEANIEKGIERLAEALRTYGS